MRQGTIDPIVIARRLQAHKLPNEGAFGQFNFKQCKLVAIKYHRYQFPDTDAP